MGVLSTLSGWPLLATVLAVCSGFEGCAAAAKPVPDARTPPVRLSAGAADRPRSARSMRWYAQAAGARMTGVALVVHGLNLNPDRMATVIGELNANGIGALRVSLRGHGDNFTPIAGMDRAAARMEAFKAVSHQEWSSDLLLAYRRAERIRRRMAAPLFLIADSYGALLALELSLAAAEVEFDRMVLFAPAVSMHGRNYMIRLLSPFSRLVLPSFSPKSYRANRGTPLAAYRAVFETLERFERSLGPKINIPALVFIDPKDELISVDGLRSLIQDQHLDRWKIYRVAKQAATAATRIHHLIVDEASVGEPVWVEMMQAMRTHLLKPQTF